MIRERKEIKTFLTRSGTEEITIPLDNVAVPHSVEVKYRGKTITPVTFNELGHPVFSHEQFLMLKMDENALIHENGRKYKAVKFIVTYEKADLSRMFLSSFNSINGITQSIKDLFTLNEMLDRRRMYVFSHNHSNVLDEFMILGCFKLDSYGNIYSILEEDFGLYSGKTCDAFTDFCNKNKDKSDICLTNVTSGFVIPKAGDFCPCCGKRFTLKDLKENPCIAEDNKVYHHSCYKEYRKLKEVDKFCNLMQCVYGDKEFKYELLPNGYCNRDCCKHIPWFKFHTVHGDIIIGWRKRVISIEWQENFKDFDFDKIFANEDVTKWKEAKRRGIHAWGEDKAYEYLKLVEDALKS